MRALIKLPFTLTFSLLGVVLGLALAVVVFVIRWTFGPLWRHVFPAPSMTGMPYVLDGDTLAFDGDIRVRLHGMDAPEMDHPEGQASKRHLQALIGNAPVRVVKQAQDKYGRVVAKVFNAQGVDVSAAMVADGYARAYTSFTREYAGLEKTARRTGAGLWGQGGLALHPELWRKAQR